MKKTISILLLFLGVVLFSQQNSAQKELLKSANENFELLSTNPEKAFEEAKKIEEEAQKINAREAELKAIYIKCGYYRINNDFENMMAAAKSLSQQAKIYKIPVYIIIAKRFLFEAYMFNDLPNKALQELKQSEKIINELDAEDSLSIMIKSNFFISYANYYSDKKDYKNRLKFIKLSGKEFTKISDEQYKQKLLYVHYSNLAGAYIDINNPDSAKYYAELSMSKDNGYGRDDIQAKNLSILGEAMIKEKNIKKALYYFKEAEKLKGYKNHLNIEDLYDNIIEAYKLLQQEDSVKLYQAKKDSLKLNISESQNRSLHKLLDEKESSNPKKYIYIFAGVLTIMSCFIFFIVRKNRLLARQEKISQQYLEKNSENPSGEDYSKLLKALQENDPAFMYYFEEIFPGFSSKLLQINPKISSSEIAFCALLKMKIPTKEIAKYQYIEPQSVRNKKHTIRKKLHIPKEYDIYQFINEL